MSLKKFCDRTLSYVQNKHRFFLSFFLKGYCYCVHPYKNLSIDFFYLYLNFFLKKEKEKILLLCSSL